MSHTNTELKKAIQEHFAKQGKRMTNLSKCVNYQLLEIIEKYNIELSDPVKKERKKPEKKEKLDTTLHPFRVGEFEYTYEWDDDNGCYGGCFSTIQYKITKITKCFLTIEYIHRKGCIDEKIITKKCKIDFSDYRGWFFMLKDQQITHTKDTKTIEEKEQERLFDWAIGKVRRVWRHYHQQITLTKDTEKEEPLNEVKEENEKLKEELADLKQTAKQDRFTIESYKKQFEELAKKYDKLKQENEQLKKLAVVL